MGAGADVVILGPDGAGMDNSWHINGKTGDVYKVEFQRTVAADGTDSTSILWEFIRNEQVNFQEVAAEHKYFMVGSWSDFAKMEVMEFSADTSTFTKDILIGPSGSESFQIL